MLRKFLKHINVPARVCHHIYGKNHTDHHKICVGVIVGLIGVLLAKVHTEIYFIHLACDYVGYLLHGIGAVPIVEALARE